MEKLSHEELIKYTDHSPESDVIYKAIQSGQLTYDDYYRMIDRIEERAYERGEDDEAARHDGSQHY